MMKNKKGFTLIELMAVLIVLAVISLIVIPTVMDTINDSKKKAFRVSATGVMNAGDIYYTANMTGGLFKFGSFGTDENMVYFTSTSEQVAASVSSLDISDLKISGDADSLEGYLLISGDGQIEVRLVDESKKMCAYKDFADSKVTISENLTDCGYGEGFVTIDPKDTYMSILYLSTNNDSKCNKEVYESRRRSDTCLKFYVFDYEKDENDVETYTMILEKNYVNDGIYSDGTGGSSSGLGSQPFEALNDFPSDWNARLISSDEIDTITQGKTNFGTTSSTSNYFWLYDNLGGCETYGCKKNYAPSGTSVSETAPTGYWTSDGKIVDYKGTVTTPTGKVTSGVRPVITITKGNIVNYTDDPVNLPTSGATFVAATSEDTHKGIVYMDPTYPARQCNAYETSLNVNSNGTPTGITSGCMKFYIYDEVTTGLRDGAYKMLLDHNTSNSVQWISNEDYVSEEVGGTQQDWNNYIRTDHGPVTANKQLAIDTAGWIGNPGLISADEIAEITGASDKLSWNSSNEYGTDISQNQSSWFYFDGDGNTYSGWRTQVANTTKKSKYYWLYDYTYGCVKYGCKVEENVASWGYWTSSPSKQVILSSSAYLAWYVSGAGNLNNSDAYNDYDGVGLRPVITIPKSLIPS